eukprot:COSAG01_NODE_56847_length_316_cov_0.479263_1_plen_74_part_01
MAKFKADSTSEEDKQQWIDEYKKAMEPQDQLPLLFQTMTVRSIPCKKPVSGWRERNFAFCSPLSPRACCRRPTS